MNHLFLSFYNLKNLFRHKEYLGKQKGSSGVKGSLLNHLDKKEAYSMAQWSTFIFKSVESLLVSFSSQKSSKNMRVRLLNLPQSHLT